MDSYRVATRHRLGSKWAFVAVAGLLAWTGVQTSAIVTAGPAQAAEFAVTNLDDSGPGSLRAALADAAASGESGRQSVILDPSLQGTLTLESSLDIDSAVDVRGVGSGAVTIAAATDMFDPFFFAPTLDEAPEGFSISGFTLTTQPGGVSLDQSESAGAFELSDLVITNGAMYLLGGAGAVSLTDVTVRDATVDVNSVRGPFTVTGLHASGESYLAVNEVLTTMTLVDSTFAPAEGYGSPAIGVGFIGGAMDVDNVTVTGAPVALEITYVADYLAVSRFSADGDPGDGTVGSVALNAQFVDGGVTVTDSHISNYTVGANIADPSAEVEFIMPVAVTNVVFENISEVAMSVLAASTLDITDVTVTGQHALEARRIGDAVTLTRVTHTFAGEERFGSAIEIDAYESSVSMTDVEVIGVGGARLTPYFERQGDVSLLRVHVDGLGLENNSGLVVDGAGAAVTIVDSHFAGLFSGVEVNFGVFASGAVDVVRSTFADEGPPEDGGLSNALRVAGDVPVTVDSSTFSSAPGAEDAPADHFISIMPGPPPARGGAAILADGLHLSVTHTTFDGRPAITGIGVGADVTFEVSHSILDADAEFADVTMDEGTLVVDYSVFDSDAARLTANAPFGLTLVDGGGNQFSVDEAGKALAPLGDYGGLTPTLMLLDGSVAREAGDPGAAPPPTTDQRGYARIYGVIDIGAVEVHLGTLSYDLATTDVTVDGGETAVLRLVRTDAPDYLYGALTARLSTVDGTAIAGTDYVAQSGALVSIPAGELTATVEVATLSAPDGGTVQFTADLTEEIAGTVVAPDTATITVVQPGAPTPTPTPTPTGPGSPTPDVTVPPSAGSDGSNGSAGSDGLASTGFSGLPLALLAIGLIAVGGLLVLAMRRRFSGLVES